MSNEKHKLAITEYKIDPKYRIEEFRGVSLEGLSREDLIRILNYKGLRLSHVNASQERIKDVILKVEETGFNNLPDFVKPMSSIRYSAIEKIHLLRQHGLITNNSIPEKDIEEAYTCIVEHKDISSDNKCLPENYRVLVVPEVSQDVSLLNKHGFKDEEDFKKQSAIYYAFIIKRLPREEIKRQYGLTYNEIYAAVKKVREFHSSESFLPSVEIYDAIEESKRSIEQLYTITESSKERIDEFDKLTNESYLTFIKEEENRFGDKIIIMKGIAKERAVLVDSYLKSVKELRTEREHELELKGLIGTPVNLNQINVYNNLQNPSDPPLKANSDKPVDDTMQLMTQMTTDNIDYESYIPYLSNQDQAIFKSILDKIVQLYFKDQEGTLKNIDIPEENIIDATFEDRL